MSGRICRHAARKGCLRALRWAHARYPSWVDGNRWLCNRAAAGGQLETLAWLRDHGAAWGDYAYDAADRASRPDILDWLKDNGCPWEDSIPRRALLHGRFHLVERAMDNGIPAVPCPTYGWESIRARWAEFVLGLEERRGGRGEEEATERARWLAGWELPIVPVGAVSSSSSSPSLQKRNAT